MTNAAYAALKAALNPPCAICGAEGDSDYIEPP